MQLSTIAIIQARMASSRLPGKVLLDIGGTEHRGGQPMLVRVVERARRAKTIDAIAVATTTDPADDPIAALCTEHGYPFYRGSMHDVLDRYYQAARTFGAGDNPATAIIRLTGDCPVIDPGVIDETVSAFLNTPTTTDALNTGLLNTGLLDTGPLNIDFAANRLPPPWHRTIPIGLDVEVCSFTALERAWKEADQSFQREHVMPYFYEGVPPETLRPSQDGSHLAHGTWYVTHSTSPRGFRVAQLHHYPDFGSMRWTVDTAADLEFIRLVYARFNDNDDFSWLDVLTLLDREPSLAKINAEVQHKTAFDIDHRRDP
jgi:spore coat polysaccharide biosynthesis protein SpsF